MQSVLFCISFFIFKGYAALGVLFWARCKWLRATTLSSTLYKIIGKIVYASEEEQARFVETLRLQRERWQKWYVRIQPSAAAIRHNNRLMRKRLTAIGYYNTFIPEMRRLSQKYDDYCMKLEEMERMLAS